LKLYAAHAALTAAAQFPRRFRRGLIEAVIDAASISSLSSHFRGDSAAASLKPNGHAVAATSPDYFRGDSAAASLKRSANFGTPR